LALLSPVCTQSQTKPNFQRDYIYDSKGHLINTAEPDIYGPFAPTGVSATYDPIACAVDLSWNAATDLGGSGVRNYLILQNGIQVGQTTALSYADPVNVGGTYSYTVIAVDNAGNLGPASAPANVHTHTCVPPPGAPKKTSATTSRSSVASRVRIFSLFRSVGRATSAAYKKMATFGGAM
jgi:hypothetical protein